ncbi:hypothetical protein Cgig2_023827 [Carnegiea gigantea]|uniref:Uncharacterized protein n=1 Tax=Carnegiea gigantea TaxID=171969 RepID=A0A9Q1QDZ1_9CARY|nr:hypothetical protein Cgig2_023827 [Carnegiea gigantea]
MESEGESSATEVRPPLLTMTSKGIHPSGRSGITGEERRQRVLGMPLSPFIMAISPLYDTREMADYVRESFIWRWRKATRLRHPLPEDYHILCPRFSLPEAERAAAHFELPEMVQVAFYIILLNEAVELGLSRRLTMDCVMWAMRKLDWGPVEAWLGDNDRRLRRA